MSGLGLEFPADAICDHATCGHRFARHTQTELPGELPLVSLECADCKVNQSRGFRIDVVHEFVPRKLAGGALTAADERLAYERAMREGRA